MEKASVILISAGPWACPMFGDLKNNSKVHFINLSCGELLKRSFYKNFFLRRPRHVITKLILSVFFWIARNKTLVLTHHVLQGSDYQLAEIYNTTFFKKKMRRHAGKKIVYLLYAAKRMPSISDYFVNFDQIITYNLQDSKRYDYNFLPFPFRKITKSEYADDGKNSSDILLIQAIQHNDHYRIKQTANLIRACKSSGLKLNHYSRIVGGEGKISREIAFIVQHNNISASGSLDDTDLKKYIANTNVVVSICQDSEDYISGTIYQAFYLNKKVLTDAKSVKKLLPYSKNNVKVVDDFSKITKTTARWFVSPVREKYSDLYDLQADSFVKKLLAII
jgi:hypothetical protein